MYEKFKTIKMDISDLGENKKQIIQGKLKDLFGKDIPCTFNLPKITTEQLNIFKDDLGFELIGIPSLKDLQCDDDYFNKFYPHKNKFWKSEYQDSIINDHKKYGGKFLLYESIQKPNFLHELQQYGTEEGQQKGLDKLEQAFVESYEYIEANDNLEEQLASSQTRYSWSYNMINKYVLPFLQKQLKQKGLPGKIIIRPATNFIDTVFFPYNGKTETYEWTNTTLVGSKDILTVGHAPLGGLSCVLNHDPKTYYTNIGVRFAVVI